MRELFQYGTDEKSSERKNLISKRREEHKRANILAILSGVISTGVSISSDLEESNTIFDAAREANNRFEFMSNDEIISYCQGLTDTQLNGMVSLVHGRYFENIVAEETGGTLFESHTHANTDIMINGTEISIKSNDTTADGIIEFETLSPKDLGMDDAELIERTAEVMDGDIIDATDALISGTVGFGTMAMLQAVGKSIEEWEALSEYDKTNMRAAWLGTKATGRVAVGTAKSTWSLLKLAGKGMGKAYEVWEDSKAARNAKDNFRAGKAVGEVHYSTTADVCQDYVVEPIKDVGDAFADLFTTDEKVVSKSNGGLGRFNRK